jgi:hypothetical protein
VTGLAPRRLPVPWAQRAISTISTRLRPRTVLLGEGNDRFAVLRTRLQGLDRFLVLPGAGLDDDRYHPNPLARAHQPGQLLRVVKSEAMKAGSPAAALVAAINGGIDFGALRRGVDAASSTGDQALPPQPLSCCVRAFERLVLVGVADEIE